MMTMGRPRPDALEREERALSVPSSLCDPYVAARVASALQAAVARELQTSQGVARLERIRARSESMRSDMYSRNRIASCPQLHLVLHASVRSATVQHTLPRRARTHEAPPAIPEISATPLLDDSDLPSSPLADAAAKALCTMEISSSSESSESEPDEQMEPVTRRRTRSQLEQETPPSRRRARHACSAGAGVGAAAELQPRAPGVVAAAPIEPCAIHGPVMTAHDESMTSTRDALPQQLPAPAAASEPSAEPAAAGDGESPLQSRARGPLGVLARIFGGERHGSPSSASRSASANALRPDGGASRESSPPARLRGDRRASRLSSGSARGATPAARRPPARPHDDARMDVVDAPEAGGRPSSRSRARGPSPVRRSISGKAQLLRRGGRLSDAPRVPRAPSTVPTVLQWHGEGNDVSVVGSFNAWAERIPMLRSPDHADWYVCLALPPGEFGYRFVVDGQWRHAPEQPLGRPGAGGGGLGEQNGLLHNVVVVADQTEYEREDPCADGADAPRRDGAGEEEEGEEEDDGFSQRVSSSALALLAGKPPAQLPAFLQAAAEEGVADASARPVRSRGAPGLLPPTRGRVVGCHTQHGRIFVAGMPSEPEDMSGCPMPKLRGSSDGPAEAPSARAEGGRPTPADGPLVLSYGMRIPGTSKASTVVLYKPRTPRLGTGSGADLLDEGSDASGCGIGRARRVPPSVSAGKMMSVDSHHALPPRRDGAGLERSHSSPPCVIDAPYVARSAAGEARPVTPSTAALPSPARHWFMPWTMLAPRARTGEAA